MARGRSGPRRLVHARLLGPRRRRGPMAVAHGDWPLAWFVAADASTRLRRTSPASSTGRVELARPAGHGIARAVSPGQRRSSTGASAATDASVIGSTTSWTWPIPSRGVGAQRLGDLLRRALERRDGHPRVRVAHDPARAAGHPDLDRHGALDRRRVAADGGARLVHERPEARHARGRVARVRVPGVPRVRVRQRGREHPRAAGARSGSAGPPGRAGRGRSSASRAVKNSPSKSMAPCGQQRPDDRERLLEPAIRWSNGAPSAANSTSFQPAPRPRTSRPPEISSTVAACLASMNGLVERGRRHERAERHALGGLGEAGQRGPGLPRPAGLAALVPVQQVVAEPDGVEAGLLGGAGDGAELRPADLALHLGELDADPEGPAGSSGDHVPTLPHGGGRRRPGNAARDFLIRGRLSPRAGGRARDGGGRPRWASSRAPRR